jgi:hypothetical protein
MAEMVARMNGEGRSMREIGAQIHQDFKHIRPALRHTYMKQAISRLFQMVKENESAKNP